MSRICKRSARPAVAMLEGRLLLDGSTPAARWIGQDGHDLVGPTWVPGGDDVQDIRIGLSGLDPAAVVASADVRGLGGGQWMYNGPPGGPWAAAFVRPPGSTTADLFIEPFAVEVGRWFSIDLKYADGKTQSLWFMGGAADPNLRMPDAALLARWIGQDGSDRVGPGPSVGPDGIQDARLELSRLSAGVGIDSATLTAPDGTTWAFGANRQLLPNAELVRLPGDATRGDFYANPPRNLNGQVLTLKVFYSNGKVDEATVLAGATDPALAVPAPAPIALQWGVASARWVGQAGDPGGGLGHVKLSVGSIPAGRSVSAAFLGNEAGQAWVYRSSNAGSQYVAPSAGPMTLRRNADGTADLFYPPSRDESGSTLTLRLVLDDGTNLVAEIEGGAADPGRKAAGIAATAVDAKPGDDLNDLANRFGTVRLAPGVYDLDRPLVLNNPVAIVAPAGGVTLRFSQAAGAPAWSTAIKVHASHTTLEGFAVRFAGPIRWRSDVAFGPALIGTTDNLDGGRPDPKVALRFAGLDLETPPVPAGSWVEAPKSFRLVSASFGTIAGNRIRGGGIQFFGGPWTVVDNTYTGTVPGTFVYDFIAAYATFDLRVERNHAEPVGPSGKTWRFLVNAYYGSGDVVRDNTVVGLGPRDGETLDVNTNEIILTEAYSLSFEGRPSAISADGRVLQVPVLQGGEVRVGDAVAVLAGPGAGQWRRVALVLSPTAFLLDEPLPAGTTAVSIGAGFVDQTYQGNTIDSRGGRRAFNLVLVGNHFGTKVLDNTLLGGDSALKLTAAPSQQPVQWGWTRAPFLGGVIAGNTIVDAWSGAQVGVEQGPPIKTNKGRVYFSADLRDNVVRWTRGYLDARASAGQAGAPPAWRIGYPTATDPGENLLTMAGNMVLGPKGFVPGAGTQISTATINGVEFVDASWTLPTVPPPAPTGLALLVDTGLDPADGVTRDGRVAFGPDAGTAVGFEYSVGDAGAYLAVADPAGFLPVGLVEGSNRVRVRSVDATGNRGPEAVLVVVLDTVAPAPSPVRLAPGEDTGLSTEDGLTCKTSPAFEAPGAADDTLILLRDGAEIARRVGPGRLVEPGVLADGAYRYSVRSIDRAGNAADGPELVVTVDATAPAKVTGLVGSAKGVARFDPVADAAGYEYRVGEAGGYIALGTATTFYPALAWGTNRVFVRAFDAAGNRGPVAEVVIVRTPPKGAWTGQKGRDYAGLSGAPGPDGRQDAGIVVEDLPAGRSIVAAELIGEGETRGRWTVAGGDAWAAVLVPDAKNGRAELFFQPHAAESGRPFLLRLTFDDGTTAEVAVAGGTADPFLRMPAAITAPPAQGPPAEGPPGDPAPAPSPSPVRTPASPTADEPGQPPAASESPAPAPTNPGTSGQPGGRAATVAAWQRRFGRFRQLQLARRPQRGPLVRGLAAQPQVVRPVARPMLAAWARRIRPEAGGR